MAAITSISNPRVAAARKLSRKSVRDETGRFLIEGCRAVATALGSRGSIVEIFLDDEGASCAEEIRTLAGQAGAQIVEVNDRVLKAVADTTTPQGVVAVAEKPATTLAHIATGSSLVLVAAGISDPGNAGTLIRSAIAANANGVVFTDGAVDPFGPKTTRAAAGMIFEIPIATQPEMPVVVSALRDAGLQLVGASADAPTSITELDLTRPIAIVLGNEARGIGSHHQAMMDVVAAIPMPGPAESLNVGVAGSILLFEAVRQRGPHAG
jgi:RNA methyltransferase, TrmH family